MMIATTAAPLTFTPQDGMMDPMKLLAVPNKQACALEFGWALRYMSSAVRKMWRDKPGQSRSRKVQDLKNLCQAKEGDTTDGDAEEISFWGLQDSDCEDCTCLQ